MLNCQKVNVDGKNCSSCKSLGGSFRSRFWVLWWNERRGDQTILWQVVTGHHVCNAEMCCGGTRFPWWTEPTLDIIMEFPVGKSFFRGYRWIRGVSRFHFQEILSQFQIVHIKISVSSKKMAWNGKLATAKRKIGHFQVRFGWLNSWTTILHVPFGCLDSEVFVVRSC